MKIILLLVILLNIQAFGIIGGEATTGYKPVKKLSIFVPTGEDKNDYWNYKCMATRVSSQYLLTAGHCFVSFLKYLEDNGVDKNQFEYFLNSKKIKISLNDGKVEDVSVIISPTYLNLIRDNLDKVHELNSRAGRFDMALIKYENTKESVYPLYFDEICEGEKVRFIGRDSSNKTSARFLGQNRLEKSHKEMHIIKGKAKASIVGYGESAEKGDSGTSLIVKHGNEYKVAGVLNMVNKYAHNIENKPYIYSAYSQLVLTENKDFLTTYIAE